MSQAIGYVTLIVEAHDAAIGLHADTLGRGPIEDTFLELQNKR